MNIKNPFLRQRIKQTKIKNKRKKINFKDKINSVKRNKLKKKELSLRKLEEIK
jgi:hypothetical protein